CEPGSEKFIIQNEKNPNKRGIETIMKGLGGQTTWAEDFHQRAAAGEFKGIWIVGGYPKAGWASDTLVKAAGVAELLVVQDIFPSALVEPAEVVLPMCAWTEREGTFMNHMDRLQAFARAVMPPEGAQSDGQFLFALAGHSGLYSGERVREMMAAKMPVFAQLHVPPVKPLHQH